MATSSRWARGRKILISTARVLVTFAALAVGAASSQQSSTAQPVSFGARADLLPPSSKPLADYEKDDLFPWLDKRQYARLGWVHDAGVRDTGPLVNRQYFGTHPAVRIYYSPEVMAWLEKRQGELPNGAIIVKEMFHPPATFYQEIASDPYFAANPTELEALLEKLVTGWSVMIKDRGGNSKDGWFWAAPSARGHATEADWLKANVDDDSHVRYAGFGLGTCIRCHASAEKENTFASMNNIGPPFSDAPAIRFHIDNSWRGADFWGGDGTDNAYAVLESFFTTHEVPEATRLALRSKFNLPEQLRPWRPENIHGFTTFVDQHKRPERTVIAQHPEPNQAFIANYTSYADFAADSVGPAGFSLPMQWADHVYPGPSTVSDANRGDEFVTANNCLGCHGGLGGTPSGLSMFVKTGEDYGQGYNVSEFGEWRWSPMGLAGRDPIFHAQLESEMILLLENAGKLQGTSADARNPLVGSVETNQKALVNTCLSCHGAMGQRQLTIDHEAGRALPSGSPVGSDFDPDFFYLSEALTGTALRSAQDRNGLPSPPHSASMGPNAHYEYEKKGDFYQHHDYGELARGGISCAVCHRIAAPGTTADGKRRRSDFLSLARHGKHWLPEDTGRLWMDNFIYFLAENTTGQFERAPADKLLGPFDDVAEKPMQNAMGITPVVAAAMSSKINAASSGATPFIADSNMCGTCHTINLPNIGQKDDKFPILTQIENNPAFKKYAHSIEQATYLEWLNSDFGPGKDNVRGEAFKSCQDCHMPNALTLSSKDGEQTMNVDPLVSQIASIQDAGYAMAENALPAEAINVPLRPNYRRHEFVGLNAFVVAMAAQFPDILGVDVTDYETSATSGPTLAIESMLSSTRQDRVATLAIGSIRISDGKLLTKVSVTNQTGHRFPSGVSFRRAFLEFLVLDENGRTLWGSGRTNAAGLITDGTNVLPTEFLETKARRDDVIAQYQPHYQVISEQGQVQIYEELVTDAGGAFTTSFIHRVDHIKDNRLLPRGWIDAAAFSEYDKTTEVAKQGRVLYEFMLATDPEGASVIGGNDPNEQSWKADPDYVSSPSTGSDHLTYAVPVDAIPGAASVRITLYSQALMPAWLHQRFETAVRAKRAGLATPATDRLHYIASRLTLDTQQAPELADWKLRVSTQTRPIPR